MDDENNSAVNETTLEISEEKIIQSVSSADQGSGVIDKGTLVGDSLVGLGGTSSLGVFRPSTRQFIFNTAPISRVTYGLSTDKPVTGDWDNDGKTEIGVFRNGQFILDLNNDGVVDVRVNFGVATDTPITGDWDDDGYYEIGVFRKVGSSGQFILDNTNCNTPGTRTGVVSSRINFGVSTDLPVPIDWDDDGSTNVGIWRPSTHDFIYRTSTGAATRIGIYGVSTDTPFSTWSSGGLTYYGVWRKIPPAGQFISPCISRTNFGVSTDKPITGKDWEIPPAGDPTQTEIINAHQYWRNMVGSPTLIWSSTEAASAQSHANTLAAGDGSLWHDRSGQNIAWSSGSSYPWTNAINAWAGEKSCYVHGPFGCGCVNTGCLASPCAAANDCAPGHGCWNNYIGHYTQVVWKNSLYIGCGKASSAHGTFCVCNYNPHGNYLGQYAY